MTACAEECYTRVVLLLLKGGSFVGISTLDRHIGRGSDFQKYLYEHRQQLISFFKSEKYMDKLFPHNETSDPNEWDFYLLVQFILTFLPEKSLSQTVKNSFETILNVRNTLIDHSMKPYLSDTTYQEVKNILATALKAIAIDTLNITIQDGIDKIIRKYTVEPLSIHSAIMDLKAIYKIDSIFQIICSELENREKLLVEANKELSLMNAKMDELKDILLERIPLTKGEKHYIDVDGMALTMQCDDTNKNNDAYVLLCKLINDAKQHNPECENTDLLKYAINDLLKKIELNDDAKVTEGLTTDTCTLVSFKCTLVGLLYLLNIMKGTTFQNSLKKIAHGLREHFHSTFAVSATIPVKELERLIEEVRKLGITEYKRSLTLKLQCNSLQGLSSFLKCYEDGGLTNSLNKVSEALSEFLGEKITLTASVDLEAILKALTSPDEAGQSAASASQPDIASMQASSLFGQLPTKETLLMNRVLGENGSDSDFQISPSNLEQVSIPTKLPVEQQPGIRTISDGPKDLKEFRSNMCEQDTDTGMLNKDKEQDIMIDETQDLTEMT